MRAMEEVMKKDRIEEEWVDSLFKEKIKHLTKEEEKKRESDGALGDDWCPSEAHHPVITHVTHDDVVALVDGDGRWKEELIVRASFRSKGLEMMALFIKDLDLVIA